MKRKRKQSHKNVHIIIMLCHALIAASWYCNEKKKKNVDSEHFADPFSMNSVAKMFP